jgi:hypothetical protein
MRVGDTDEIPSDMLESAKACWVYMHVDHLAKWHVKNLDAPITSAKSIIRQGNHVVAALEHTHTSSSCFPSLPTHYFSIPSFSILLHRHDGSPSGTFKLAPLLYERTDA